jgi:hypothetical protein
MVASSLAQGLQAPDFRTLAAFHPQAALAIACGVPVRPNLRTLSVTFSTSADIGQVIPASFSEVVGSYSIFAGADITVDPTNAFPGNPLKYLNDVGQALVSGITFRLVARGGDDYTPIPDETPLQSVPRLLSAAAGIWTLDNPDNVKAYFTLQAIPNAASEETALPMTVWLNLAFLMLGAAGREYLCVDAKTARCRLKEEHGFAL